MAEAADRKVNAGPGALAGTSPSIASVKGAIHDTRARLAGGIVQTSDRLDQYLTGTAVDAPDEPGAMGVAVTWLQHIQRARSAWSWATRTGLLRHAGVVAAVAGIAAFAAVYALRRRARH
jgi:hypothetical protein